MLKELIYFFFTSFKSKEPKIQKPIKKPSKPNIGTEISEIDGGIVIRITQTEPRIEAEIIASNDDPTQKRNRFLVGEVLQFNCPTHWGIGSDFIHPLFSIGIDRNGKWHFECRRK